MYLWLVTPFSLVVVSRFNQSLEQFVLAVHIVSWRRFVPCQIIPCRTATMIMYLVAASPRVISDVYHLPSSCGLIGLVVYGVFVPWTSLVVHGGP